MHNWNYTFVSESDLNYENKLDNQMALANE